MNHKKNYINALRANCQQQGNFIKTDMSSYDYIATHYWEMTKEELKDIILELDYEISHTMDGDYDSVADELSDRWDMEHSQEFGYGDIVKTPKGLAKVITVEQGEDETYRYDVMYLDYQSADWYDQDELEEV